MQSSNATPARRTFMTAAGAGAVVALAGQAGTATAAALHTDTAVGLVPYFDVNEGKLEEFKALGPKFIALTRKEKGVLYYGFSYNGQTAHCREGYVNADAVLAHLANVDAVLKQALAISKISRLEIHGPAAEVEKLKAPLAALNPQFFVLADGAFRR